MGLAVAVADRAIPPFEDVQVAEKLVIGLELGAPAMNVTVIGPVVVVVEPERASAPVGAAGEPTMTGGDTIDAGPVPIEFLALTVHV